MTEHDHAHAAGSGDHLYEAKVLTVSDSVVLGNREDTSGPAVVEYLEAHGFRVVDLRVCPDGSDTVSNQLSSMAYNFWGLIVTAGGTGFGPRDMTPEGTVRILDRRAYGFSEAMRATDPKGRLSRGVSGTRGSALILNVAGSPAASKPMLDAVIDVIPHALDLMAGKTPH
ncbi:MAG: MogA/MoaB family molybdenum cofactor biosynthesis protein [Actinobacteria bacterium]|nr:MogA/MoaB family molybdenum cofactor biosynthesis protein [Actinomycetota bacterium]